jgi:subtilisin family serine protease
MASPVAAGVAALILGYDDTLTPKQLKELLLATTTRYPGLYVFKRGLGEVYFSELSRTGGIINAFNALENLN